MMRCSEKAYAKCPDRALCGSRSEAVFTENSECAVFNLFVEDMPVTNAGKAQRMTEKQAEIILAYAECNMNAVEVGRKLYMSAGSVDYHLSKIRKRTGRDPRRFYDLCYLVGVAVQRLGGANDAQGG